MIYWQDSGNRSRLLYQPASRLLTMTLAHGTVYRVECLGREFDMDQPSLDDAKKFALEWLRLILIEIADEIVTLRGV